MKTIIVMLAIMFSAFNILAQDDENYDLEIYEAKENIRELGSTSGTGAVQTFDNRYKGVKGTQFAFKNWYTGEIFLKEKKKVRFPGLNYDAFDNQVSYRESKSGEIYQLNSDIISFFMIYGSDTMKFVPLKPDKKKDELFAEILYDGKTKLYRVYQKEFLKANYEGGYSADREYDEFIDKIIYYAVFIGKEPEKFKPGKKIYKTFPDHQSEIKKIISNYSNSELDQKKVLRDIFESYDNLN